MASRLWIGRDNPLIDAATITARSDEGGDYSLSNLQFHQLEPPYRTADQALDLNAGDPEYGHVTNAIHDILGSLTLAVLIRPDTVATDQWLIHRLAANNGFALALKDDEIRFWIRDGGSTNADIVTDAANLQADLWYLIVASFHAGNQTMKIYVNHLIEAATLNGVIPNAITASGTRLTICSSNIASNPFDGEIAFAAIDNTHHDHGGLVDPAACVSYYNFQGDLTDDVGGADLTAVGIDDTNYVNCTAFAWIGIEFDATQNPKGLFVDPRKNLATGATWKLCRGDWFSTYELIDSGTVIENEPIISLPDNVTNTKWWLEFLDPDNLDGYLEFPFIYLGQRLALTAASLSLNRIKAPQMRTITQVKTEAGNVRTSVKSGLYVHILSSIYPMEGADLVEMLAAAAYASQGKVIIFCYDSEDAVNNTWAMYWLDAATFSPQLMRQRGPAGGEEEIESAEIDFLQLIESA